MRATAIVTYSLVGALLFLFLACGGSGGSVPTVPDNPSLGQVEHQSANLVNSERATRNVNPQLGLQERVAIVARSHSEAMRAEGRLFHSGSDGDLASRLADAGIECRYASENVSRVSSGGNPAAQAHLLFMESSSHRANILSSRVSLMGVGVARSGDTYWITQVFVGE